MNKRLASNETKYVVVENELDELSKKVKLLSTKGYNVLVGSIHFTGAFVLTLKLLISDNNKNGTNWISIGLSAEKIEPFDVNLAPTMTNLENRRVILEFNNLVLVQKNSSSLSSNFFKFIHKL